MKKFLLFSLLVIPVLTAFWFYQEPQDALSLVRPEDFNLKEGDLVGVLTVDDPDIFIVNQHGYKRLFLNPVIFSFYGHLGGFDRVKKIGVTARDAFVTSTLFRNCETNDAKVYALELTGEDTATLHWVNVEGSVAVEEDPQFFNKIFCINNNEFKWYQQGSHYTSLNQIFDYSFTKPTPPPGLTMDLKVNGSDNPDLVAWNSVITVSWTSHGATRCTGFDHLVLNEVVDTSNLPTSGSLSIRARALIPTYFAEIPIFLACVDASNRPVDDMVIAKTTLESRPSLNITSLASPTTIQLGSSHTVAWTSSGFEKVNIILYKKSVTTNDLGKFWYIAKGIPSSTGSYAWNTSSSLIPDTYRDTTTTKIEAGTYVILLTDELETMFEGGDNPIVLQN